IVLDTLLLGCVLFTGVLPWFLSFFTAHLGSSPAALAGFIFLVGILLSIFHLPLSWYAQFRIEQRFGFNTSTQKTWSLDRVKGLGLALLLGYPLLLLILKLVDWMANSWWLWAWAAILIFQLVVALLAPVLILPLFNKSTPVPEVSVRERLLR